MRTVTYDVPGIYFYLVPAGVTELLNVDIVGGQGGADWSGLAAGGKGGRAQVGILPVEPLALLTIIVGGPGTNGVTTDNGSGAEGTGVPGGNGITTGTIAGVTVAGEGRSGGGGGGGVSAIYYTDGGSQVIEVIASGGGGGGGSWSASGRAGGDGGVGGPWSGGADNDGHNGSSDTGPGSFTFKGYGGSLSQLVGGGSEGTTGQFGRKGAIRNGAWVLNGKTGGGGGGGGPVSGVGAGRGGGGRDFTTNGSGAGGSGGAQLISSSFGTPTGVVETDGYQTGDGYVTFEVPGGGGIYLDEAIHLS